MWLRGRGGRSPRFSGTIDPTPPPSVSMATYRPVIHLHQQREKGAASANQCV